VGTGGNGLSASRLPLYKEQTHTALKRYTTKSWRVSLSICRSQVTILSAFKCTILWNVEGIMNNPAYCNLWPVYLYHIFPHYLINGMIFENKLLNMKCVFWFSLWLLSQIFLILRIIQRDVINGHRCSRKVRVRLVRFSWNLHFVDRFPKITTYQIHEKLSNVSRVRNRSNV
jgi:hypothetical protein